VSRSLTAMRKHAVSIRNIGKSVKQNHLGSRFVGTFLGIASGILSVRLDGSGRGELRKKSLTAIHPVVYIATRDNSFWFRSLLSSQHLAGGRDTRASRPL
jgi:hypothetical protein